jgi:hypothetical protein
MGNTSGLTEIKALNPLRNQTSFAALPIIGFMPECVHAKTCRDHFSQY